MFAEFEVGGSDFYGVEIVTFDVFDERDFEFVLVAEGADDSGDSFKTCDLAGAVTALTSDDSVGFCA